MNTFEYSDMLWDLFTNDEELTTLLEVDSNDDSSYAIKFRQENFMPEEFESSLLNFIAWYFPETFSTYNDYMGRGILAIDIYAQTIADVPAIRERIVKLMFEHFNLVVYSEGQYQSGIRDVYKYRLEYVPLVSRKG